MNLTNELDIQSAFVGATIAASSISLIVIHMYKDIITYKSKSKYIVTIKNIEDERIERLYI